MTPGLRTLLIACLLVSACSSQKTKGRSTQVDASLIDASDDAPSDDAPSDANPRDVVAVDLATGDALPPADVIVTITADNAYSFGYGDSSQIVTFFPGARATEAGEIFSCPVDFGPERYVVPGSEAPSSAYLYIASWDDMAVTQGVLAQFLRGVTPLYSGDASFEVCATGMSYISSSGPPLEQINTEIVRCNEGSGDPATTSSGWVNAAGAVTPGAVGRLAVGEINSDDPTDVDGSTFPPVCTVDADGVRGIDEAARWMWYDPADGSSGGDPFRSTGRNVFRAFLIFRIAAGDILY